MCKINCLLTFWILLLNKLVVQQIEVAAEKIYYVRKVFDINLFRGQNNKK